MAAAFRSIAETPQEKAHARAEVLRLAAAARTLGAKRVILFGSRARGDAIRGSDVDLLVVMPCPPDESYPGRLARVAAALAPGVSLDLLVYTPEEFADLRESRAFVRQAVAEGEVLVDEG